jgi:hypothetical protein
VQNLSINGRVFFEEGHKYYHEDDAQDNTVYLLKIASMLSDLTGLIKDFHEEFDTIPEAKYVIRHKLSITWEPCFAWDMLGDMASLRDNLHGYGESLFNKWGMQAPDLAKTRCGGSTQRADIKICVGENRASSILSRA